MASEEELRSGDVVQLRSGGPRMTLEIVKTSLGKAHCSWFEGNRLQKADFEPEALIKVDPRDDGMTRKLVRS